jgi:hypothetical protein
MRKAFLNHVPVLLCADGLASLSTSASHPDYLLHQPTPDESISLKQVEFNTIFVILWPTLQVTGMHR